VFSYNRTHATGAHVVAATAALHYTSVHTYVLYAALTYILYVCTDTDIYTIRMYRYRRPHACHETSMSRCLTYVHAQTRSPVYVCTMRLYYTSVLYVCTIRCIDVYTIRIHRYRHIYYTYVQIQTTACVPRDLWSCVVK